ncbi:MAG: hypothetical protein NT061_12895 [Spirochaetes bacterium]|nr:hypothetical protein [Spirochaetota bacterium]
MLFTRIALSFVVAGLWISAATLAGERLGVRRAGLITNLPSNILISLLFVALTKGTDFAVNLTAGVPMGMLIDTIFLVVFMAALRYGTWPALGAALAAWILSAALVVGILPPLGFWTASAIYVVFALLLFRLVTAILPSKTPEKKPVTFSWKVLSIRAFFAGSVVAGAVSLAQVAPPYMTGVLATFPAVLSSTIVILSLSQGPDFARATGRILVLSSTNIVVYAAVAGLFFPIAGPWLGTLAAFAAAFLYIFLLGKLIQRLR